MCRECAQCVLEAQTGDVSVKIASEKSIFFQIKHGGVSMLKQTMIGKCSGCVGFVFVLPKFEGFAGIGGWRAEGTKR